ncbi:MAG TPA: tetratricopeptide repeat protein [Flavipsychrobacter sp.]|nr:tetratricopeptide repeat protein [Flavipsychrobacter sp.]
MKERIDHIFESSTCLTRRQVTDYVNKTMSREECLAAEHHINSCGFCSAALDGLTPQILKNMDNGFLKEHLSLIRPQVHLSSIAPTASGNLVQRRPKKNAKAPLVKTSSITAALLLGFGVLWYLQYGSKLEPRTNNSVVQKSVPVSAVSTGANLPGHKPAEVSAAQPQEKVVVTEASFHPATQPEQQRPQPLITTKPGEEQTTASKTEKPEANSAIETEKKATENNSDIPAAIPKPAALPVKEEHRATPPKASSKKEEQSPQELYESGKYGAALNIYKKQMSSNGSRSEQEAALQAANCYLKLGQKDNAVKLMQSLVETGNGSPRRQAKRQLKDLEKSEAE